MPITRCVEYGRQCDNPKCRDSHFYVECDNTRAQAEASANDAGWVKVGKNEWLCKVCAEQILPAEALAVYRELHPMRQPASAK